MIRSMRIGSGGGLAEEGEDIEVLELPIDQALAMIADGRIVDAKTIMLLQYAALHMFEAQGEEARSAVSSLCHSIVPRDGAFARLLRGNAADGMDDRTN